MKINITGKVAVGICDWICEDILEGKFNRGRINKFLKLAMKYNTNKSNDTHVWIYNQQEQTLTRYYGTFEERKIVFKKQYAY